MPRLAVWLQVQAALTLSHGVIASPTSAHLQHELLQDGSPLHAELQPRKLHGRFLHITDFHPDEFYKPHTSTEDGIACHRGKGMAGTFGAERTDCDSPYSLVDATLKWVQENIKDSIDFVVWTGDSARHDSDEDHPRSETSVLDNNRQMTNKMIETFSSSNGKLTVPIIPNFGNNDFLPHNIMYPGPNRWFAAYADIWGRLIPEEQRHSFQFGGWFHVDVIPGKLTVFSLNTMYFFDRNAAVDGCAEPSEPGYKHMEWLRIQLELMRQTGVKVILIGHVPPARTDSKQNWDETCWQRYTLWLQQYRDVVVASLYGHMNIDHFFLSDTRQIDLNMDATQIETKRQFINESDFVVQGKEDYLQELRDLWGDLPDAAIKLIQEDDEDDSVSAEKKKKKHRKFKKIGGKYAERYQLSFISPSVVPNYFPTMRVFEYNITGLDKAAVWQDKSHTKETMFSDIHPAVADDDTSMELRSITIDKKKKKKKKGKGRKGRKGKGKPKDPNLIIPADPPRESLPGPAYYPQQFTLTGYTQYFANLTHINNDHPDLDDDADGSKWRDGNHNGKKPKHSPARPREFQYEVEYSTFDDKRFKLKDLTVRSYVHLAYRMGQRSKDNGKAVDMDDFDDDDESCDDDDNDVTTDDIDANKGKKHKKKKKKGKKGKHEKNKTWLRWLSYAFVQTVPEDDLKKM
ncbi:Endopolyphosphatase [Conoideocrella luteorostrata]|uniref:Endopolyphosphatase n=1 Tax=Conoideocrella luteorostrata TaxID=1105319 RepID=A0AAJ0FSL1_9HYPO|nr:Endopolyphosphatase [Conoideocrella luteorostrata]